MSVSAPVTLATAAPEVAASEIGPEVSESSQLPHGIVKMTLKANQYFDQACRLKVLPISQSEISVMRARWSDSAWLPPAREVNPNDNQLSVLARLSSLNYNLLAFDMGVWGPFAARRERHFQLTTFQLSSRGEYQAKEVPGAHCLEDWMQGWAFATAGFVMANVVERGIADAYAANFVRMSEALSRCMAHLLLSRVGVQARVCNRRSSTATRFPRNEPIVISV